MKNWFYKNFITLGPIGYLPASGTLATLCTLPIAYALRSTIDSWLIYCIIIILLMLFSWHAIYTVFNRFKLFNRFTSQDPREIVIDEVVGTLITFSFVQPTLVNVIVGFILFRFFDISKFPFIYLLEKRGNALAIILDDCAAGVLSAVLLYMLQQLL